MWSQETGEELLLYQQKLTKQKLSTNKVDTNMDSKYQGRSRRDPRTEVKLPTWIATGIGWRRQVKELGSPVADFSLLLRSRRKHMGSGPTAPQVSTVIGWNWYAWSRWAYFLAF